MRAWKTVQISEQLQAAIQKFNEHGTSPQVIFESGCIAFLALYGASTEMNSLNNYRFNLFKRAASRNAANLKSMCPTERAAK